ncbi:hypothetical protein PILCRDRAFT_816490 [Piloderma croceum F 1598]|uniref:Uncharacterized protein n=1 Tax=Piloderma croceum (strain F 1598) TaxID=765440 RepID=A0A0C3C888_PILCF|nr:hypothetical protein PILCRDRAFT_816490 [Piloderma croceum F 1598]
MALHPRRAISICRSEDGNIYPGPGFQAKNIKAGYIKTLGAQWAKDEKGVKVANMLMQVNDLLTLQQLEKSRRNLPLM